MRYSSQRLPSRTALPVSALICIASVAAYAQQTAPAAPPAAAAAPAPAAAAPTSLSSSLGVIVFPAKDQSSGQQSTDEQACYGWAKSKTGIDPAHITAPQPADSQASSGGGERARGGWRHGGCDLRRCREAPREEGRRCTTGATGASGDCATEGHLQQGLLRVHGGQGLYGQVERRAGLRALARDPSVTPVPDDAPEAHVARGGIDGLGVARGRTVAPAVIRRAQV